MVTAHAAPRAAASFVDTIRERGVAVIPQAFGADEIARARTLVLSHLHLMHNTRPTPSSRHLAGFHRFAELDELHRLITANRLVLHHLRQLLGDRLRTIGLSDITVNRSQPWHKDLLRGPFQLADGDRLCEQHHGKLFKVIAYLQDSQSLHVVPGSHRVDIPLESDDSAVPSAAQPVHTVNATAGDAVVIDICTTHRGSSEDAFADPLVLSEPRILVSTVFGAEGCAFAERMAQGNAARLAAWVQRYG